ncbi:hypothetical protein ACTXT7_009545 [Hymenolepis weldensis]
MSRRPEVLGYSFLLSLHGFLPFFAGPALSLLFIRGFGFGWLKENIAFIIGFERRFLFSIFPTAFTFDTGFDSMTIASPSSGC